MKINRKLRIKALTRKLERHKKFIKRQIGTNDPDTFWRHNSGSWLEKVDYLHYLWGDVLRCLIADVPLDDAYQDIRDHENGVD